MHIASVCGGCFYQAGSPCVRNFHCAECSQVQEWELSGWEDAAPGDRQKQMLNRFSVVADGVQGRG